MSNVTKIRSVLLFGLAVGVILGLYAGYAVSALNAKQGLVAHAAASTGRIQVVSAQRINLEQQAVSVVVIEDTRTRRDYLIVAGGQVIPLDEISRPGAAK